MEADAGFTGDRGQGTDPQRVRRRSRPGSALGGEAPTRAGRERSVTSPCGLTRPWEGPSLITLRSRRSGRRLARPPGAEGETDAGGFPQALLSPRSPQGNRVQTSGRGEVGKESQGSVTAAFNLTGMRGFCNDEHILVTWD